MIHPLSFLVLTLCVPEAKAPDFDTQIVPILTKAGCNAGSCHGAAIGRGGFKLSLYGSQPAADHAAIVHQWEGRRVNLARPAKSLLLAKPTMEIDHEGGYRLDNDGAGASRLLRWIAEGATRTPGRYLIRLDVQPSTHVATAVGERVRLETKAHFNDETVEDVTKWTVFTADDPAAVDLESSSEMATLQRRGRHLVIARFLDRVVPIELIVPLGTRRVSLADQPRHNFIDTLVYDKLERLRLPVGPPADDLTFLRRVHLDLTGRLPDPHEVQRFEADRQEGKRARRIDQLLASDAFVDYWAFRLARLLRVGAKAQDMPAATAYYDWLYRGLKSPVGYDQMALELLTASGDTHVSGPANFYRVAGDARTQAEFTSELFMGARLRCANCHDHPLDRWTQDDYHGMAAIFASIERGRVIRSLPSGRVIHPGTGEFAVPKLPAGSILEGDVDGRLALAEWLIGPDNPFFAQAIVNRLWQSFFGRGLVHPTDDMRATNPPTHPQLLGRLATDFVDHGYDLRHTMRLICQSAAYQRGSATVRGPAEAELYFAVAPRRSLDVEVLVDAIADVTGVAEVYGGTRPGTRAIQLVAPNIQPVSLEILGRCARDEVCQPEDIEAVGGLKRRLHLLNGPVINAKITAADSRLRRWLEEGRSPREIVREFYLRALTRRPTMLESMYWDRVLAATGDRTSEPNVEALDDFLWSLLNCKEFVTNH